MRATRLINNSARVGLSLAALLLCTACSKVRSPEVPGHYTCNHAFGKEELVILPNGEFRQTVYLKEPPSRLQTAGKWEFDPKDCYITFTTGFIPVVDNFGNRETNLQPCDRVMVAAFREFWRIKLMLNESVYYNKCRNKRD